MEENHKINDNEKSENLDLLINIAKEQSEGFFIKTQALDTKIGIFIALYAAIIIYLFNLAFMKNIFSIKVDSVGSGLKLYSLVIITIVLILITLTIVIIYIYALVSKNCRSFDSNLYQEEYYDCKNIDLKIKLVKAYRNQIEYNYKVLYKKHTYFNIATYGTIIVLILLVIDNILKLCLN